MKHANVSIFVPHNGCPHQCSFCSQRSITGQQSQPTPEDVRRTLDQAVRDLGERIHESEIAFFGGSFTAIDRRYMISLLDTAYQYVKQYNFTGIRLSTRPDAVDAEVLRLLRDYGVTSIELGAQSMDDRILGLNGRGHTSRDVEEASALIQEFGFSLGLQMMTGLYGDKVMRFTPGRCPDLPHGGSGRHGTCQLVPAGDLPSARPGEIGGAVRGASGAF